MRKLSILSVFIILGGLLMVPQGASAQSVYNSSKSKANVMGGTRSSSSGPLYLKGIMNGQSSGSRMNSNAPYDFSGKSKSSGRSSLSVEDIRARRAQELEQAQAARAKREAERSVMNTNYLSQNKEKTAQNSRFQARNSEYDEEYEYDEYGRRIVKSSTRKAVSPYLAKKKDAVMPSKVFVSDY